MLWSINTGLGGGQTIFKNQLKKNLGDKGTNVLPNPGSKQEDKPIIYQVNFEKLYLKIKENKNCVNFF